MKEENEEIETLETFIHLDFKGAIPSSTLKKKDMFFKMVNLDTDSPFVQLDDVLYKGTYKDATGTNIFFEETENINTESLQRPTPIKLKHLLNQTKILELERVKLPENEIDYDDDIKVKFDVDYKEILEKLESDSFQLEDYIKKADNKTNESDNEREENEEEDKEDPINKSEDEREEYEEEDSINNQNKEIIEKESEEQIVEEENKDNTLRNLTKEVHEISNMNMELLKKVAQEPLQIEEKQEFFHYFINDKLPLHLQSYMTIELILQSLNLEELHFNFISKSHQLVDDKETVVIDNFENLSLVGKLYVLIKFLETEEQNLKELPKDELIKLDIYGNTPLIRHEFLKLLAIKIIHLIAKKINKTKT